MLRIMNHQRICRYPRISAACASTRRHPTCIHDFGFRRDTSVDRLTKPGCGIFNAQAAPQLPRGYICTQEYQALYRIRGVMCWYWGLFPGPDYAGSRGMRSTNLQQSLLEVLVVPRHRIGCCSELESKFVQRAAHWLMPNLSNCLSCCSQGIFP